MKATLLVLAIAAGLLTPAARADTIFIATLDALQAGTAGSGGQGAGSATVTLNSAQTAVDVLVTWSGLTTPASAAHIHCCAAPGSTAGVVVAFPGFPAATSGTYSATGLSISAADVTGLFAGLAYVNIHDSTFPAGEIRGQLTLQSSTVPEPFGGAATGIVGLLALTLIARRRLA